MIVRLFDTFEELPVDAASWDRLLACGSTDVVFLTLEWQRIWWENYRGERLLLITADEEGEPTALAPLFVLGDMLFLVGSGDSDYLDFIGDLDEATLAAMLAAACRELPDFAGIRLYHLPVASKTTALLPGVAARLGLELHPEGGMSAPYLDLTDAERVRQVVERRKLRKEENRMRRGGAMRFRSATMEDLDLWLEEFFAQHTARWAAAGEQGLDRSDIRSFCRAIAHTGQARGWLRFTMLEWCDRPAAFDITLTRGSRHLSYLVSRDASLRAYSPGKLLEAHVIKEALGAGARCYDFGLGDEEYKLAHATGVAEVANWALWPR
jgi:CelD/BcsL family acetyltransferase involved in cellulose biosynthesis